MRIVDCESIKAPKPFNNGDLWRVKAVSLGAMIDGAIGFMVRSRSNFDAPPEQEIWAGYTFETPWDMEFHTNQPKYEWLVAYCGEDSWQEVAKKFKEIPNERSKQRN